MYREGITSHHHGVAQAGYSFSPTSSICVCVDVYGRDFSLVLLLQLAFPIQAQEDFLSFPVKAVSNLFQNHLFFFGVEGVRKRNPLLRSENLTCEHLPALGVGSFFQLPPGFSEPPRVMDV